MLQKRLKAYTHKDTINLSILYFTLHTAASIHSFSVPLLSPIEIPVVDRIEEPLAADSVNKR